jgi:two-component system LytT family response regulator
MTSVRTMVVDDEQPARVRLLELLEREPGIEVVGTASDGHEAVEAVRRACPQLLFLDVQIPRLNGFDVLRQLAPDELPITIMVAAYDTYAMQAFDAHAIDYLLKPFSDQRFEQAIARARKHLGSGERRMVTEPSSAPLSGPADERPTVDRRSGYLERLVLKSNGCITFLDVNEVDWLEAAGVYIYVHAGARRHLYRSSITQMLQRLDPQQFVRIHRSAAVNTSRIRELRSLSHGDYALILKDGTELTLSRVFRSQLEEWLRQPI